MSRSLIVVALLALAIVGCGGSGKPGLSGRARLDQVAQRIEDEVEVTNTRCHFARGGDGDHFYCLVDPGHGGEFKLEVALVAGEKQPLITNCETAGAKRRPGYFTLCAFHKVES